MNSPARTHTKTHVYTNKMARTKALRTLVQSQVEPACLCRRRRPSIPRAPSQIFSQDGRHMLRHSWAGMHRRELVGTVWAASCVANLWTACRLV